MSLPNVPPPDPIPEKQEKIRESLNRLLEFSGLLRASLPEDLISGSLGQTLKEQRKSEENSSSEAD